MRWARLILPCLHHSLKNGFAEWPDFLSCAETLTLRDEALLLHRNGAFKPAGIGRGRDRSQNIGVRLDETLWFDQTNLLPGQQALWNQLQVMMAQLNRSLFLGLWELEGHFALYPSGAFYAKHIDRFHDDDLRVVSCVVYLNPSWKKGDGGELKIYNFKQSADSRADSRTDSSLEHCTVIEPTAGKMVFFLSDKTEHEVLETVLPRLSFAGWFRRRP